MKKNEMTKNEAKEKEAFDTKFLEENLDEQSGAGKEILINVLDQIILAAISSILVVAIDYCMNAAGYRFVRDNGSIIGAGAIIYFIFNCIYAPLMAKTKAKKTIAKKILSI